MKKVLKVIGLSLLGIIVAAYIFLFIAFNGFKPEKIDIQPDEKALGYFNETYEDCRADFIKMAEILNSKYSSVEISRIPVENNAAQDLFVDLVYVPAQDTAINLLILTSGLHGVEGFTGSAVQLMAVNEILNENLIEETGILLVHGINAYGFKNIRKVCEDNVDLNRNCAIDPSLYQRKNEGYGKIVDMLQPTSLADHANTRNRNFHLIAIQKIIAESMGALKQAALQGQYEYPKGIYYGGQRFEPQIKALAPYFKEYIEDYDRILTIDLHTGYGANGVMHLFPNPIDDPVVKDGLEDIFSGYRIVDSREDGDFYTILGSFIDWIGSFAEGKLYLPMLFEYGTLDSQKTFGSLKSIQNMILENQGTHYGYKNNRTERKIKESFREMYYPSSEEWRTKVIVDSKEILTKVMERLSVN